MFSEKALFDTQVDVAKAGTVNTISHLSDTFRNSGEYLNYGWIQATVAALVGFVIHGLIVSQVIKPSTGNKGVDAGLADVVKVGTVMMVSQIINTSMAGGIELSEAWMRTSAITLVAFFVFHVAIASSVPEVEGYQATVMDIAKVTFTSAAVHFISGQPFNREYGLSLAGVVGGFAIYHEIVHPRVFV